MWAYGLGNGAERRIGVGDVDLVGVGIRTDVAKSKIITGVILSGKAGGNLWCLVQRQRRDSESRCYVSTGSRRIAKHNIAKESHIQIHNQRWSPHTRVVYRGQPCVSTTAIIVRVEQRTVIADILRRSVGVTIDVEAE